MDSSSTTDKEEDKQRWALKVQNWNERRSEISSNEMAQVLHQRDEAIDKVDLPTYF